MKGDHEETRHMRLGVYRVHGEWFTPAEPVLDFIRANAITPRGSRKIGRADSHPSEIALKDPTAGESRV